jgi:hypothetical protein
MKDTLMRSPGRGGGVLEAVKGMGEVDLRAELFIRRFKEDMRLQSQRSAEEFQAMLARGLRHPDSSCIHRRGWYYI